MSNILQALNESLADEIMAIAKSKGMNPRLRGTPEQERERTQQMLAQRAKDREMNPPPKPTLSPEQVEQLKQSLEQEEKGFDPYYEYSDDHGYWTKQKEKAQRIGRIKQQLKDAGVELKEQKIYSSVSVLTEARIYKLWENAGQKINEAQLTADQIKDLFSQIEQSATAAGSNRTLVGKGADAAGAVSKAWSDLKDKIYNSKPMSNFAAAYDKAAEQLKQATGGDEGAMKYIQKYRDFAQKHPVLQSAIYSALIAAAGISSAGLGGAAMLGLLKMVDQAIQGKDIRSAMWSGAKTGAMAYGASKIGDLVKGQGSTSTTTDTTGYSQEYTGQTGDYGQPTYNLKPTGGDMQYVPRPGTIQAGQGAGNTIDWGGEFVPKDGSSVSGTLSGVTSDQITSSPVYKQVFADQMKRFGNAPGASIDAHEVAAAAAEQAMLKGGVKESIELSESQIRLVIGTIAGASNLQEGIGDAFKTFVNTGKQNWSKDIAAVKGVAGKAADWAKTKGHNLTTKVTADKLMQAWKKAGSPTDSLDVASVIQNAGVSSDIIKQVYSSMKIPAPGEAGGGAQGTRDIPVDPSSVAPGPVSTAGGQTPSTPSGQASAPATGVTAGTQGAPAKAAGATSGYQQVKQLLTQLDKRGKMNLVKMLEKELAVTEDILSLTESELQLLAELSPETLASYKKKAGQSASQADKEGNYKLGDKRFSGIVRATKKELDKDVAKHKQDVEEGFMDMFNKKEQSPKGPQILYYVKNPDGTKTYVNIKDAEQLADVQKQYQGKDAKTLDLSRQDVLDWLQSRGVNLRKFWPGATITVGGRDAGQNVEEELEQGVAEARRANTSSARAELSNRPRKPDSDKEKEDKKKESDAAWERLMQYAADQKKDVAEATMTPQQVAAAKAAAPYGYNPQTGKPNPAPAQRAPQQAPAQTVQQRADATQQRLLDKMGARFGLPPGSSAEQVQAAQQAYLDKNDPKAAAQYKQNMANIDAGNTAVNKPVQLAKPQAQAPQQAPQAPQTPDERMKQKDPDFHAGMQAQKAGGSPIDIMLAQPSIANNQKLLDAIGSAYGLPAGSTIEQIKAAASGKKASAPQTSAVAESTNFEESFDMKINELAINEDWQKVNKKDKTDGMSKKAVKAYRRENPGSKLQTAVTTKPSKLKNGSKSAKRRKSFCARMKGMKKAHASAKTKRNPDSPINKALRRWNCESVEQMQQLVMIAEQKIALLKEAANPAQQAAIAISMKKKGQKPKSK